MLACLAGIALCAGCGSGTTGNNGGAPTWNYTALGDSLAFGALAAQGYVPRYASYVNTDTGFNVDTTNLGVPSAESADLLTQVQSEPVTRSQLQNSQIITFDIGGNDLNSARDKFNGATCGGTDNQDCLRNAVTTFKQNWGAILGQITSLKSPQSAIIRTMDIYNPFVAADMKSGNFAVLEGYLDQVNSYIHSSATAQGIQVANVHQAFNGADGTQDPGAQGLLAADGFHPNDAGHKVIADQLRALGYAPLK
jgi:lysophospholipase L1-like esterase